MPRTIPRTDKNRRKPGKALEKVAREIKDSDDFLEHIANLSSRYRREYALELGPQGRAVRESMRVFRKHAAALVSWLQQAHKESGSASASERAALDKIGMALYEVPGFIQVRSKEVQAWLAQAAEAADGRLTRTTRKSRDADGDALRIAAAGLRATFERHQLKFSTRIGKQSQGDAVRLLCAIAKDGGDAELTPQEARVALVESGGKGSRSGAE